MTLESKNDNISAEFVETFAKLREGEITADRMEKLLDQLEDNINELLVVAEELKKDSNRNFDQI
ncbi:HDL003Wp [Eremothecium sinecaudum]|uniref:HDL003Wp n=1 Tax=Eremothecium sinecaudum TaxID=45286 RepID=A0A0X8HRW7_9SACH|nr:HDL003Wp [Eremothecium sinecaudum]AMD20741.1 HDL003Wp [Eremothecium sinecaudum]